MNAEASWMPLRRIIYVIIIFTAERFMENYVENTTVVCGLHRLCIYLLLISVPLFQFRCFSYILLDMKRNLLHPRKVQLLRTYGAFFPLTFFSTGLSVLLKNPQNFKNVRRSELLNHDVTSCFVNVIYRVKQKAIFFFFFVKMNVSANLSKTHSHLQKYFGMCAKGLFSSVNSLHRKIFLF